jgi:hypothetical protein
VNFQPPPRQLSSRPTDLQRAGVIDRSLSVRGPSAVVNFVAEWVKGAADGSGEGSGAERLPVVSGEWVARAAATVGIVVAIAALLTLRPIPHEPGRHAKSGASHMDGSIANVGKKEGK